MAPTRKNRRAFIRIENGKANLAPPSDKAKWVTLISVDLGNSTPDSPADRVGVVTPWTWQEPRSEVSDTDLHAVQKAVAGGRWRKSPQATDWVGRAIAGVLGLDLCLGANEAKVKELQKRMTTSGRLVEVEAVDAKRTTRTFVEVGQWIEV